jgi:hypothetical protein
LQIAGSLVLLVVAALFVRSLSAMQTMDFGFKPDHVMNFAIDSHQIGMNDGEARDLAANITANLHQLAGVDYVSHAGSVPLGYFNNGGDRMVIDGAPVPADPNDLNAGYNVVSPEYFSVMGIDLLRGRAFTEADKEHSADVAVISETPSAAPSAWQVRKTASCRSSASRVMSNSRSSAGPRHSPTFTFPMLSTSKAIR